MKKFTLIVIMIITSGLLAQAQQYTKFTPSDPSAEDGFAWALDIDGDYMVISNIYDDDLGIQSGSLLVYHYDGTQWNEQQKLTASDGGYAEYFAYRADIHDDQIIVGAYRGNDNLGIEVGTAYIYKLVGSTWEETAILQPDGGEYDDRFGQFVSIWGDYAIVGANGDDNVTYGDDCGAAYLYYYDGSDWILNQKIEPNDLTESARFGVSVSITDLYMAIGAGKGVSDDVDCGVVYMYNYVDENWEFIQKIIPDDGFSDLWFGKDVQIDNTTMVVGAYHDNVYGEYSGSAYIYNLVGDVWTFSQKIIPPNGNPGDLFGHEVSIKDNDLLSGALFFYDGTYESGAAYYYTFDGSSWNYESTIRQPDPVYDARFGSSVATDNGFGLVGAPFDDDNGYRSGSAYLWDLSTLVGNVELSDENEVVKIFPTIAKERVFIEQLKALKNPELQIFSIDGRLIQKQEINNKHSVICISNLNPGNYTVITFSENYPPQSNRIIIQ